MKATMWVEDAAFMRGFGFPLFGSEALVSGLSVFWWVALPDKIYQLLKFKKKWLNSRSCLISGGLTMKSSGQFSGDDSLEGFVGGGTHRLLPLFFLWFAWSGRGWSHLVVFIAEFVHGFSVTPTGNSMASGLESFTSSWRGLNMLNGMLCWNNRFLKVFDCSCVVFWHFDQFLYDME